MDTQDSDPWFERDRTPHTIKLCEFPGLEIKGIRVQMEGTNRIYPGFSQTTQINKDTMDGSVNPIMATRHPNDILPKKDDRSSQTATQTHYQPSPSYEAMFNGHNTVDCKSYESVRCGEGDVNSSNSSNSKSTIYTPSCNSDSENEGVTIIKPFKEPHDTGLSQNAAGNTSQSVSHTETETAEAAMRKWNAEHARMKARSFDTGLGAVDYLRILQERPVSLTKEEPTRTNRAGNSKNTPSLQPWDGVFTPLRQDQPAIQPPLPRDSDSTSNLQGHKSNVSPQQEKQILGEALYSKIELLDAELAGKITGMLLESETTQELRDLIEDDNARLARFNEAVRVHEEHVKAQQAINLRKIEKRRTIPMGMWENEIENLEACMGDRDEVVIIITWRNGRKTPHTLKQVYERCPQKMLRFYASILTFESDSQKVPSSPVSTSKQETNFESASKNRSDLEWVTDCDWDEAVAEVNACNTTNGVIIFLTWKNGFQTQHPLEQVFKKCPKKMLQFFESNLVFKKIDDPSDNAGRDSAVAAPNSESTPATFMPPGLRSYQPSQTVRPPWDYGARFHTYTGSFGPNSIGTQPVTLIKNPMKQPAKVAEKEKTQVDHNARLKSGARPILDTYVEHPVYDPEKRRMEAEIIRLKSQIKQNRKTQRESLRAEISKLRSSVRDIQLKIVNLESQYTSLGHESMD